MTLALPLDPSMATPPQTRGPSPTSLCADTDETGSLQTVTARTYLSAAKLPPNAGPISVILDGDSLKLIDVVAIAECRAVAQLTTETKVVERIDKSVAILQQHLDDGELVYGVTTGFGGSADVRTTDLMSLQRALVQMQNTGVLTSRDIGCPQRINAKSDILSSIEETDMHHETHAMPSTWVRASMLVRCNSIVRGHSAVRAIVAQTILALLRNDIIPIVPLRGSISASGDLSPLSYIAGAIEGSPDIFVRVGAGKFNIMTAQEALQRFNITPVALAAKEGLGLMNGTAFSTATAAIAISKAQEMLAFAQILTAMGVEALQGTAESFDPQIAKMRPHPGQIESSSNIISFLSNSHLANPGRETTESRGKASLCQDRYAFRTASQWLGPQIEDMKLAHDQIEIELNSTTDNPVVDLESSRILHGGNFQAAVVTSAMDRCRLTLDKLGRMLFAQATEIINPSMNKGLPPNLCSDDPSLSFTCKGIDINMASYASELAFLANPVGNHVMSAEMHNQAINSLGLISSRYTIQALEVIQLMVAAHLFVVCQALDLRVLQLEFFDSLKSNIHFKTVFTSYMPLDKQGRDELRDTVVAHIKEHWPTTTTLDLKERSKSTSSSLLTVLVPFFEKRPSIKITLRDITEYAADIGKIVENTYAFNRKKMYEQHGRITPSYLGEGSLVMYYFVRYELGIRFHRGLIEHPTQPPPPGMSKEEAATRKTIGTQISAVYEALRDGKANHCLTYLLGNGLKPGSEQHKR